MAYKGIDVSSYQGNIDWSKVKFFTKKEFNCRCCTTSNISANLVLELDIAGELVSIIRVKIC